MATLLNIVLPLLFEILFLKTMKKLLSRGTEIYTRSVARSDKDMQEIEGA